jgi:hypothetical protein
MGHTIAYKTNRDGVAASCAAPAVHKTMAVDLALIPYADALLQALALSSLQTAKPHAAQPLYLGQTVPDLGQLLSLVLLYASPDIARCASVQDCVSSCRRGKCARASAGNRSGPAGKQIGNAHRKWAFSEAAGLFLRNPPAGPQPLARLAHQQGKGKARTSLAPTLARAVYAMRKRHLAFDRDTCLHGERAQSG